jgi:hypothetical protein
MARQSASVVRRRVMIVWCAADPPVLKGDAASSR